MGETNYTELVIQGKNLSAQAFAEATGTMKAMGAQADAMGGRLTKTFGDLGSLVQSKALGLLSAKAILGDVQDGFRTLAAFVSSSVDSYASAEAAAKKMTTALRAQGTATPAVIAQYDALASQFQRTTVYSDDLINEMQALLTSVGDVAPAQMDKALQAATNLASGLGIDLHSATLMVAKASDENVVALKKAGVQLDETRVKGEGMSYILGEINQKFGGQAQAEIDTYAGKVKQLANEWDNFKEAVGRSLIEDPALQALLRHLSEGITGVGESAGKYTPTISEWWVRLSTGSQTLEGLVGWFNAGEKAAAGLNAEIGRMKPPANVGDFGKALEFAGKDPFAGMMADAKATSDGLMAQWKKEDEAAKKHGDAIEAMFRKYSGADATAQMRDLDTVFKRLASSGQLTEQQIDAIVKEALKLQSEGGQMTARLWEMVKATDALSPGLAATALDVSKIGTQVDIVVPKLDAYLAALKTMAALPQTTTIGSLTLGAGSSIDIGKPNIEGALKAIRANTDWVKSLGQVTQAFDVLAGSSAGSVSRILTSVGDVTNALQQAMSITTKSGGKGKGGILTPMFDADATSGEKWSAGISAGMTVAAGAMSVWNETASAGSKSAGAFMGAMGGAKAGAAFGPWGVAVGAAAGAVVGLIHSLTAGRREVENFAKSFDTAAAGTGFDELQVKMLTLGDDYDRLWKKLTQETKKGDKKGAQAIIAEIQAALANTPEALAAAAGYQTTAQLQAVADKAKATYDYMVKSGQYSASEIARAFEASGAAQKAVLGDTSAAQQEALDAITAKYAESFSKLDSEYKALSDSVAGEAEEEFMGIVETQQRARMEQIAAEKKAQEAMRDAEIAAKQSTFDAIADAGAKTYNELRDLYARGLDIPYRFRAENVPGGSAPGGGGSAPAGASASARAPQAIELHVSGKVLARTVLEELPAVGGSYGAAVRR